MISATHAWHWVALLAIASGTHFIKDIRDNTWVTMDNDFSVMSEVIWQWFSRVMKSRVKIIAELSENHCRIASRVTKCYHCNKCIISFPPCYFMSWTHKSVKNDHRVLLLPLLPRVVVSDLALWHHHNWSVMSHECEMLLLWCHFCWFSLHTLIVTKAIFTSE